MTEESNTDLEQRVEKLELSLEVAIDRINELEDKMESGSTSAGSTGGGFGQTDNRDAAVLERLEPGEKVKLSTVKKLYQTHTDVNNPNTLKNRARSLVNGPDFEETQTHSTWVYMGDSNE